MKLNGVRLKLNKSKGLDRIEYLVWPFLWAKLTVACAANAGRSGHVLTATWANEIKGVGDTWELFSLAFLTY